jgi:uncharacterized membrane protein YbaN (DUF454 family)
MVKKYALIAAGFCTFILGVIGIFLPLLPTTPFLLLSAAFFLRSSDRLYRWITNHKVFGKYIKYYFEYRAVTKRSKIITLGFLWAVILSSILFIADSLWLKIILAAVAVGVTIHIVTMRTLTKEMMKEADLSKAKRRKAEFPNK